MADYNLEIDSRLLPWLTTIEKMGKQKSYKPILLLSIINEIEKGNITKNKIKLTESIEQTFDSFYNRIDNAQGITKVYLPFYYLQTDLWVIHWDSPTPQKYPSSITGTRKNIDYVSFKHGYFEALMDPSTRNIIKERLILKAEEDIKSLDPRKNPEFTPPSDVSSLLEHFFGKLVKEQSREKTFTPIDPIEVEFQQEKYLQAFLVENWNKIKEFKKLNLEIFGGSENGVEFNAGLAGRIDILAQNPTTKDLTIIELKKGLGKDHHLTQVLRYMGWVRSKFVSSNEVSGILIASTFQKKIRFVIQELSRVSLLKYNLFFQLEPVKLD